MELNRKDVLKAAAAATSEFVKNLYCGEGADENEPAVTFETTITLLDKDATPISVIRSTKTSLEPTENFPACSGRSEGSRTGGRRGTRRVPAALSGILRLPLCADARPGSERSRSSRRVLRDALPLCGNGPRRRARSAAKRSRAGKTGSRSAAR